MTMTHHQMFPFPVIDQGRDGSEGRAALGAEVSALARVDDHVDLALLRPREGLRTEVAWEGPVA